MANHGPKYGLTSEVDDKRSKQYSKEDEADVTQWIEGIIGEKLPGPDFQACALSPLASHFALSHLFCRVCIYILLLYF